MELEDIKKEIESLGWEMVNEETLPPNTPYNPEERLFLLDFKTKEEHSCPGCGLPHRGHIGSCKHLPIQEEYPGADDKRKEHAWFDALEVMRKHPQEVKS